MLFRSLGEGCPLRSNIESYDCEEITEIGISALGGSCHLLSSIDLSCCSKSTDIGTLAHAVTSLTLVYQHLEVAVIY